MKAIVITAPGGPEVLQLANRPDPLPDRGEILVKVLAAGVNRPDVSQRKGHYPPPIGASPDIPGLEIAGIVMAKGEDCKRWNIGDSICALVTGGGYAEYCVAPEAQCLPVPEGLSMIEAASLPETYFTVWSNVIERGRLTLNENILIHGGAGGIGSTAIQIAKQFGATVFTTSGTDKKQSFCKSLGADHAMSYKDEAWTEKVMELTKGNGVDLILDMIGAAYMPIHLNLLAADGRLIVINHMKGDEATIRLGTIIKKRLTITGSALRPRDSLFKGQIARKLESHCWPWFKDHKLKTVVNATFPLEQASEAHRLMESGDHLGKIILTVG